MQKMEIKAEIQKQRNEINSTMEAMGNSRGMYQDVLRSVLPIFEAQLNIMDHILDTTRTE